MTLHRAILIGAVIGCACAAKSELLSLPATAQMTVERATGLDSFEAPIGAFVNNAVPVQTIEGSIARTAWRIDTAGLTPLQVIAPLRDQIKKLGYDLVFECESLACGGFDFRFSIEVLPGPNMYVNIASYRYLTAFKGPSESPTEALTVLASVTAASAYVQIISASAGLDTPPDAGQIKGVEADRVTPGPAPTTTPTIARGQGLLEAGFVVLGDLEFAFGTSDLGPGPFASLSSLAQVLAQRPDLRVALVGHTDTVGDLDVNIRVSRARANAVRTRLIDAYAIDAGRLDAEGMGYLSPVASNQTVQGRDRNRRVEAVILNSE